MVRGVYATINSYNLKLRFVLRSNFSRRAIPVLTVQVEVVTGILDTFIVEPFVPHDQTDEYYVCINSNRDGEEFLFCHEGGVDVGDVDAKADRLQVWPILLLCLARQHKLSCKSWITRAPYCDAPLK